MADRDALNVIAVVQFHHALPEFHRGVVQRQNSGFGNRRWQFDSAFPDQIFFLTDGPLPARMGSVKRADGSESRSRKKAKNRLTAERDFDRLSLQGEESFPKFLENRIGI